MMSHVRGLGNEEVGVAEEFQMPCLAARGLARTFGDEHKFSLTRSEDCQYPVSFAVVSTAQNHGPGAIGMTTVYHRRFSIGIDISPQWR